MKGERSEGGPGLFRTPSHTIRPAPGAAKPPLEAAIHPSPLTDKNPHSRPTTSQSTPSQPNPFTAQTCPTPAPRHFSKAVARAVPEGPTRDTHNLGTLTSALAAIVARAAAGLPGGGDAVAVAASAQALGLTPEARPGPNAAQGQGVQWGGCPEL